MDYILGLDVGGTSTRALLADLDGRTLGRGKAGGGNPVSRGRATAEANLTTAVRQALDGADPARVRAAVVGIAGVLADNGPDVDR
ncbi:MAG TPA: BadF/BadG/BcrA/BcrD ATPase family protein, partial [Stackebrandtia sp.]|uniref:BadF/BadG/BcrA/BcrD ATPase family protein n=1 Tax=Stackebrandtia sp. TaxID=2023065 RepID=UPI002D48482D